VRRRLVFLAAISALALVPSAPAADAAGDISVKVDRPRIALGIGEKFGFRTTITNNGPATARDLVAHLNVLDLRGDVYVDPEDWSTNRTKYLDPIPAGGSTSVTWGGQAVNSGRIGLYVAVLDRSGTARPPAMGSTIRMDVTARRNLNAGGVAPLAAGVPAFLALLTLGVSLSRRRFRRDAGS
jgi:hypothetical protein